MEFKTKVKAEEGQHDLLITREFNLPLDLLFKAYEDPEIVAQWMNTRVVRLESRNHGSWRYETSDPQGNIVFSANGVIHEFVPLKRIVRTFQMENTGFEPQLEFMEFESLGENRSRLNMQMVFRSVAMRDQLLKMPFAYGLNMAHDRLQEIVSQLH